jgi:thiamine-phosphate pyrophosphorylase
MNNYKRNLKGGLYLVIDPSMNLNELLLKTEEALKGGIDVLQIWNHWKDETNKISVIQSIVLLSHQYFVPVIINENIELLNDTDVDGIHFDEVPQGFEQLKSSFKSNTIIGITCGNNFNKIEWAIANKIDYISFCSVFPSASVNTCDLVNKEIILKARAATDMPIFLSGGIDLTNIDTLKDTKMDGIAVVSGIMKADNPKQASQQYKQALNRINL